MTGINQRKIRKRNLYSKKNPLLNQFGTFTKCVSHLCDRTLTQNKDCDIVKFKTFCLLLRFQNSLKSWKWKVLCGWLLWTIKTGDWFPVSIKFYGWIFILNVGTDFIEKGKWSEKLNLRFYGDFKNKFEERGRRMIYIKPK